MADGDEETLSWMGRLGRVRSYKMTVSCGGRTMPTPPNLSMTNRRLSEHLLSAWSLGAPCPTRPPTPLDLRGDHLHEISFEDEVILEDLFALIGVRTHL